MTEPLRRADESCPDCGRFSFEAHRPDCPLAPGLAEDWSFDLQACGRAEDDYLADLYGEPRRYP